MPFSPFWIAFVASVIASYPIYRLLIRLNSRQTVSQYAPEGHAQKQGTPTMGGLIIVFGAAVAMAFPQAQSVGWIDYVPYDSPNKGETSASLLPLFLLFALIGFVDDFVVPRLFAGKRGLGWKQKILMQIVVATGFSVYAYASSWPSVALCVFCILFFSNAFNFADGLDALAGSVLIFLAVGLAALCVEFGVPGMVGPLVALVGATIPFLYLNAPKAKLFMGDVGSLAIGSVLGAVVATVALRGEGALTATWGHYKPYHYFYFTNGAAGSIFVYGSLTIISLLMVAELVPVPLQILSVKLRGKRMFPYTPIHHAFEKAGWPETRVVWHFALTQLLLSVLAVTLAGAPYWIQR